MSAYLVEPVVQVWLLIRKCECARFDEIVYCVYGFVFEEQQNCTERERVIGQVCTTSIGRILGAAAVHSCGLF